MCHQCVNPMNDDSKWLYALDASQWLSHISLISSSSADVAKFVHVHGTRKPNQVRFLNQRS
jgi:hypothetical protein